MVSSPARVLRFNRNEVPDSFKRFIPSPLSLLLLAVSKWLELFPFTLLLSKVVSFKLHGAKKEVGEEDEDMSDSSYPSSIPM